MEGEPTYDIAGLKFVKKCKEINFVLKVQKLVQSQNISVLFSEEISSFSKLLASLFDRQFIVSVAKVNQSNVQLLKSNFGCLCNSMEKSSIQIFLKKRMGHVSDENKSYHIRTRLTFSLWVLSVLKNFSIILIFNKV